MDVYDAPPPTSSLPAGLQLTPAPVGTRLIAALVSVAIYLSLFIPAVIMLIAAIADGSVTGWVVFGLLVLLAIAGTIVLDIWYVGSRSATVGHRLMGLRLVRYSSGEPVRYDRATVRWAGRIVADMFQVGLLLAVVNLIMIFTQAQRRHLLDMLADTMVVSADNG